MERRTEEWTDEWMDGMEWKGERRNGRIEIDGWNGKADGGMDGLHPVRPGALVDEPGFSREGERER